MTKKQKGGIKKGGSKEERSAIGKITCMKSKKVYPPDYRSPQVPDMKIKANIADASILYTAAAGAKKSARDFIDEERMCRGSWWRILRVFGWRCRLVGRLYILARLSVRMCYTLTAI